MKVFIAGPRMVSKLDKQIEDRLYNIYKNNFSVIVGDANGVDKSIQQFFYNLKYDNVNVFASNGIARNNIGNWTVKNVEVDKNVKGFDFYATKDIAMAESADYGFMIWNGESKGTLTNILNLINKNKHVLVYYLPTKTFINLKDFNMLYNLIASSNDTVKKTYSDFKKKNQPKYSQQQISEILL